jgi:hypothetical protein
LSHGQKSQRSFINSFINSAAKRRFSAIREKCSKRKSKKNEQLSLTPRFPSIIEKLGHRDFDTVRYRSPWHGGE